VLAVTADHGEELFDHGGLLHGWTLYEEVLRIPWVLWGPGRVPAGRVMTTRTDTLDVGATLLALAGGGEPPSQLPRRVHRAVATLPQGGIFAVAHGRWKLVWAPRRGLHWGMSANLGHTSDPEYLFDLEADPGERRNLAGEEDLEAAWLRSRLLAWATAERGVSPPAGTTVDAATRERLRALGYVR
jgi:arylsulfatase A-like enzyme